jgi:CheY-like chemotaxis protein
VTCQVFQFFRGEAGDTVPSVEAHPQLPLAQRGHQIGGSCRLLLAEDDEAGALYAEVVLRSCGCSVLRVSDGGQALAALAVERFDIAFFDVNMPRMDGLAATRAIRAREQAEGTARLPIVIVTASVFPNQVRDCMDAGADAVLAKPFQVEELRRALNRWTGESRLLDPRSLT